MPKPQSNLEAVFLDFDLSVSTLNDFIDNHSDQWNGVCVPPFWVKKMRRDLPDHCAVTVAIGYPAGYQLTEDKIGQMKAAMDHGANELAFMPNLSAFLSGMTWVKIELAKCAQIAHDRLVLFNVIIPCEYLNIEELTALLSLCKDTGVDNIVLLLKEIDPAVISSTLEIITPTLGLKIYAPNITSEQLQKLSLEGVESFGYTDYKRVLAP